MKTIELHGILAKKFGRFFKLDVKSAKEACHAIACQLPAFRQFMADSEKLGYRFAVFNGKKKNQKTNIGGVWGVAKPYRRRRHYGRLMKSFVCPC